VNNNLNMNDKEINEKEKEKEDSISFNNNNNNILNYSFENIFYKKKNIKLNIKVDNNHLSIIIKSLMQKIKKKFLSVRKFSTIIDVELIIQLKALKYLIKK